MSDHSKGYVTADASVWNYDMDSAPTGVKCFLLNLGGVATIGPLYPSSKKFFAAWAPMPKRDKEKERALGIKI